MENSSDMTALGLVKVDDYIEEKNQQERRKRIETCTGFEVANWEKACEEVITQSNRFYKGEEVSVFVDLPFFKMYGSGIYLFFSFLWDVSMLFLLLTFISVIPIVYNEIIGNAFVNSEQSFETYVIRSSIGNYNYSLLPAGANSDRNSLSYKLLNVIIDIISCLAFLVFYFLWQRKSNKISQQLLNELLLPSEHVVEVIKFPSESNQEMIEDFMNQFGPVKEVAPVKNYSEQISLSKEIYQVEMQIKQIYLTSNQENQEKNKDKIASLNEKKKKLETQFRRQSKKGHSENIKFYVTFEDRKTKFQVLNKFKSEERLCGCLEKFPENMLLNGEKVRIKNCQTEPAGIIWENVHVTWSTRWMRMFFQFLIILIIVVGGFLFISFLNILIPKSDRNIDTSSYSSTTIQQVQNTQIIESWCVKNMDYNNSQLYQICQAYWKKYIIGVLITVAISLTLIIFKYIIKIIVISIAKFQRYTDHAEQSVTMMTNLLITYISTTVLITFLMQANVFNISFKTFIMNLISNESLLKNIEQLQEYRDLTSKWYMDIGYQIWFNLLILSFVPHLFMPLVFKLLEKINQCLARKETLHKNMLDAMKPGEFQIEDHYANILMIIIIGFTFGGGMPFMTVLSFIGLITRYVYFKYVFIRFSRVPRPFNEALNKRALSILCATLIIRSLLSLYMYGATNIFLIQGAAIRTWSQNFQSYPVFASLMVVISRMLETWYYSIFSFLFILIIVLKELVVENLIKLCKIEPNENLAKNEESDDKLQPITHRTLTKSYKLENNPDYLEILAIMKMIRRNDKREAATPEVIST